MSILLFFEFHLLTVRINSTNKMNAWLLRRSYKGTYFSLDGEKKQCTHVQLNNASKIPLHTAAMLHIWLDQQLVFKFSETAITSEQAQKARTV